jgi:membrane dipeptidase
MVTFVPALRLPPLRGPGTRRPRGSRPGRGPGERPRAYTAFSRTYAADHPAPLATLEDVVAHVEHVREVAGPDHIGLGGDYDGVDRLPEGLRDVRLPRAAGALADPWLVTRQIWRS